MKKQVIFLLLIGLSFNGVSKELKVVSFNEVEKFLQQNNDTTYLVNFWATWCVPCRIELPYFDQVHDKYKNEKFKIILISLDFPSKKESVLIPFLSANNIGPEVWLLNEKDPNQWIDKVDNTWTGAIPATIIFNKNKKLFYEKAFEFEELDSIVENILIR